MRLAFSIAVHVDPDILVIDEVLSVGDQAFQAKCMEKILEFKQLGKTLLFVSHSTGAVQSLCERALWLDHGELVMDGDATEVVSVYEGQLPETRKP
jgi:ABC-type polysaccharide/polyol phosphate transport system ATPase subunit